jgi:hypothetical protein
MPMMCFLQLNIRPDNPEKPDYFRESDKRVKPHILKIFWKPGI